MSSQHDKRILSRMWNTSKVACQRSVFLLSAPYKITATSSSKMLNRELTLPRMNKSAFQEKNFNFILNGPVGISRFVSFRDLFRVSTKASKFEITLNPSYQRLIMIIITTEFLTFGLLKVAEARI